MRSILLILILFFCSNCSQPGIKGETLKKTPSHSAEITDPELKIITDEFFKLSKRFNVTFTKKVSIGFVDLKKYKEKAIGLCTYGRGWREIDLDEKYWSKASWLSKIALTYHELAHAYCYRDHDWAEGEEYPDPERQAFMDVFNPPYPPMSFIYKPEGFFEDMCPLSLLHPTIIDDDCTKKHYAHYVKEMFERCKPY